MRNTGGPAFGTVLAVSAAMAASALLLACGGPKVPGEGLFAVISTDKGDITARLDYEAAPLTVGNFVGLAEGSLDASKGKRFYDGLTFHRVEKDFVVQGGDPKGNGTGGPGYEFPDEIAPDLAFSGPGILGMANAGPGTNGSQFFITLKAADFLTGHYPVFGKVVGGQEVVDRLAVGDKMKKVTIVRSGKAAQAFAADQKSFDDRAAAVRAAAKKKAEDELAASLAAIAKQWPDLSKDADGIMSRTMQAGKGASPKVGQTVLVNYKGMFLDGKVFDQSSAHGSAPFSFVVGKGQVISGWDKSLLRMRKGEKRFVVLPPEQAYGAEGASPVIPPNAWLSFEIELVDIK